MKVFAIKDDNMGDAVLGYLIYYKNAKAFYIELPDDADPWTTPLLLSSFGLGSLLCSSASFGLESVLMP